MANTNAFALLKEDHKKVASLFAEIDSTTERTEKTREELFEELKSALEYHTKVEEEYLYPVLEETGITHELALEAEAEHGVVKALLEEVSSMSPTEDEWTAKITVMKENIEHHVEEEETEMFPKAEKVMSEEQLKILSEQIVKLREKYEQ